MKKKLLIIFVILGVVILRNNYNLRNDIAVYIDNKETKEVPKKNTGYVFDKVKCDSDVEAFWNSDAWSLSLNKLNTKTRCSLYFTKKITIANNEIVINENNKCPVVTDDGSVELTAPVLDDSLLCSAPDAYGTSYYFRGNVTNNYVKFAGYYWRIVRINGDGSIRMIYDGTEVHQNGEIGTNRVIGNSRYNLDTDNAYAGYMYGKADASSYEETHANLNNSDIKNYIDNWYINNLKNTEYEEYLADNIFCDNRTISSQNTYNGTEYSNLGYGKNTTLYEWIDEKKKPNLTCSVKNDSFSVEDTIHGNGALTYPIALLSIDEYILANGNRSNNPNMYLATGNWYWIFSTYYFDGYGIRFQRVGPEGYLSLGDYASHNDGVKPVINLKPNSLKSGTGMWDNPYTVEED